VINYGQLATETETLKKISASTLGLFGAQDRGLTAADVKSSEPPWINWEIRSR
jgi:hypothetical protein